MGVKPAFQGCCKIEAHGDDKQFGKKSGGLLAIHWEERGAIKTLLVLFRKKRPSVKVLCGVIFLGDLV